MTTDLSTSDGLRPGLARLGVLAPAGYALGLHFRFGLAHASFKTYPSAWIHLYSTRGYMLCDPLISWAFSSEGACRWSELPIPDPHDILEQAAEYGLRYGVAISFGPVSSRSIGGFARSDREFTAVEIAEITDIVENLHRAATPPDTLNDRQRHALRLVANGCRHAEAAQLLDISLSGFKARLRKAREALQARTTAEAIQRARQRNLL
ncbi:transcriptional regulator, LuxR family [Tranquillimonas rosea]|uniref:Transcriptional regulator, LuxR family n=1 Tax=Tranquillimonas rosea TaxID=641238 RepID=A0A1H9X6D4_9RHOB|nr:autoinducer binding domain-containing protein [Tranquillimonas rosea]SES41768.1 transcriptional regulator, LuxR family [Tranquillimonas rosea]